MYRSSEADGCCAKGPVQKQKLLYGSKKNAKIIVRATGNLIMTDNCNWMLRCHLIYNIEHFYFENHLSGFMWFDFHSEQLVQIQKPPVSIILINYPQI